MALRAATIGVKLATVIGSLLASAALAQETQFSFDITNPNMSEALREYAQVSGQQIIFTEALVSGSLAPPLTGNYTAMAALQRLLAGTNLVSERSPSGAVMIRTSTSTSGPGSAQSPILLAQAGGPQNTAPSDVPGEATVGATGGITLQEVTVTGSRIVRDGYSAPTPVTVLGGQELEEAGRVNVADVLVNLPAFQGSERLANASASISGLNAGANTLNLRGMGPTRTLVLFDGRRFPPAFPTGVVDTGVFPDALVSRVEVVTGGASAAYGSDAVAGVVNYILDKKYTGIKTSFVGGQTSYHDRETQKVSVAAGFRFAGDRGHVLLSGDYFDSEQLRGYERDWNTIGYIRFANAQYAAGNGQPQMITRHNVGLADTYGGGQITSGPLKGTAFGVGGQPFTWDYGDPALLTSTHQVGGNWRDGNMQAIGSLSPSSRGKHVFSRASFALTDNTEIFAEYIHGQNKTYTFCCYQYYHGNLSVDVDNAFLPQQIADRAISLGLTELPIGKTVRDLPAFGAEADRRSDVFVAGLEGELQAFGEPWAWNIFVQRGESRIEGRAPQSNVDRFALAIDAVKDADGAIVCRSTLTDPGNGCVPYNLFGTPLGDRPLGVPAVNTQAALDYIVGGGDPYVLRKLTRNTVSFDASGEPFSTWAGPVSLAFGAEWREDEVSSHPDALSAQRKHYSTNFGLPYESSNSVTEGFLETLVPLVAGKPWADSIDLNAAVRITDYSTSGSVVTWKTGLTYQIPGGLRLRATQSRDIRAPNLTELFATPTTGRTAFSDPFMGNASFPVWQVTVGNEDLKPEEADTTGIGLVYQPSWLDGFNIAVDYFQIDLKGAIASAAPQDILDLCYAGDSSYCSFISRFSDGTVDSIILKPINQDSQIVRGVDIETSYRFPLSALASSWDGDLMLRGLATRTLENETDTGLVVVDRAGDNGASVPRWSVTTSVAYALGSFRANWTGRYISAGNVNNMYIECQTDCPAVIPRGYITVDNNRVASNFTHGLSLSYGFYKSGMGDLDFSFTVHNLSNKVPPLIAQSGNAYGPHTNANLYDVVGREFVLGVRWKM